MSESASPEVQARRLELTSRKQLAPLLASGERASLRGQGLEFSGLRPYQPGDDPRFIDWNVTARQQLPHVRQYREERSRSLLLLTDCSASMNPAKRAVQLEAAALLAFAAVANRDRVGLVTFSDRIGEVVPLQAGSSHARHLVNRLSWPSPGGRTDLAPALEAGSQLLRRPGLLVLLSDFHADLPARLLQQLAARHDLIALSVRDATEMAPAGGGLISWRDAETGTVRLIDHQAHGARSWHTNWEEDSRRLAQQFAAWGIDHARLLTGEPVLPTLQRLFRRRRKR